MTAARTPSASSSHRAFIAARMPPGPQYTSLKHCMFEAALYVSGMPMPTSHYPVPELGRRKQQAQSIGPGLQPQGHYPVLLRPRAPLSSGARCACSWSPGAQHRPHGAQSARCPAATLQIARGAQVHRHRRRDGRRRWRCNGAEEAHGPQQIARVAQGSPQKGRAVRVVLRLCPFLEVGLVDIPSCTHGVAPDPLLQDSSGKRQFQTNSLPLCLYLVYSSALPRKCIHELKPQPLKSYQCDFEILPLTVTALLAHAGGVL
jgi:hypothetical protein